MASSETMRASPTKGSSSVVLDHIVLHIPYAQHETHPVWIKENFTITSRFVDTYNNTKMSFIYFKDGTFIKLFSFIDDYPDPRTHGLPGQSTEYPFGLYEIVFRASNDHGERKKLEKKLPKGMKRMVPSGISYSIHPRQKNVAVPPVRYKYALPKIHLSCSPPAHSKLFPPKMTHPSGALGITHVNILAPGNKVRNYVEAYSTILGVEPQNSSDPDTPAATFELAYSMAGMRPKVIVQEPENMGKGMRAAQKQVGRRGGHFVELGLGCREGKRGMKEFKGVAVGETIVFFLK